MPLTTWSLATVDAPEGATACLEVGGACYRLEPSLRRVGLAGMTSVASLFADWAGALAALEQAGASVDPADIVAPATRLAPLLYPGKVLCAGANYYDHMEEMGFPGVTKESQRLFFFMKPPRNGVVGEGATVLLPRGTKAFDWEVELAVVIGRTARHVSAAEALRHVAAYTVALDLSARDFNRAPDQFYKLDWVAGKGGDTCCPMGPRLVPAAAIADPQTVRLTLAVNGETKQDGTAATMIHSVAEQIARASEIMTLDPGDVLLTGTPAGVGAPRQTFLKVGDRIDAEISGIGRLQVVIAAEA